MDAFKRLRKQAKGKRDRAIRKARDRYSDTLGRIAELERESNVGAPPSSEPIAVCINRVLPLDLPFTIPDIVADLQKLDSRRAWRKQSVSNHICMLRRRGIVRRMKKAQGQNPAVYIRAGVDYEPLPFEGMTLREVVHQVLLSNPPVRQTDLVAAMLEAGYQTVMSPVTLRHAIGVILRGDQERFRQDGGQWLVLPL